MKTVGKVVAWPTLQINPRRTAQLRTLAGGLRPATGESAARLKPRGGCFPSLEGPATCQFALNGSNGCPHNPDAPVLE
jgi:hypothetical protein